MSELISRAIVICLFIGGVVCTAQDEQKQIEQTAPAILGGEALRNRVLRGHRHASAIG